MGTPSRVGNVELHLKTSDWYKHGHQKNKAYENIIYTLCLNMICLMIVSKNFVLELKQHIPKHIVLNYESLRYTVKPIPCAAYLPQVNELTKSSWLSRLLAERWEMKFVEWNELLSQNAQDWRVLLYWRLAANFGFKVNAVPFLALAQSLPVNIWPSSSKFISDRSIVFWSGRYVGSRF